MYIDFMMEQGMAPRTINCHLSSIRGYYDYLKDEGNLYIDVFQVVFTGTVYLKKVIPFSSRMGQVYLFFSC